MDTSIVLHHAPWLLPIEGSLLKDGALAVSAGEIIALGSCKKLVAQYQNAPVVEHMGCVLMPPLVNCHAHLELSHLCALSKGPHPATFTGWIENLLKERFSHPASTDEIIESGREQLDLLYESGVIALVDIGNNVVSAEIGNEYPGLYYFLQEFIGFSQQSIKEQIALLESEKNRNPCTAHAPYSTGSTLIAYLKSKARKENQLFSIHVAETLAENQFIQSGEGEFRRFLKAKKVWDDSFKPTEIDKQGSLQYLHQLGVLDSSTICVHCVHVSEEEIELIAESGASVCLCPGSNRFLDVGKAPVEAFLDASLLPSIGTDSLASNQHLSMWDEIRLLHEEHETVDPEILLKMATLGGAQSLKIESDYGTLAVGKSSKLLAVPLAGNLQHADDVLEYLVSAGRAITPYWI